MILAKLIFFFKKSKIDEIIKNKDDIIIKFEIKL